MQMREKHRVDVVECDTGLDSNRCVTPRPQSTKETACPASTSIAGPERSSEGTKCAGAEQRDADTVRRPAPGHCSTPPGRRRNQI
jgi:hypothetical protein